MQGPHNHSSTDRIVVNSYNNGHILFTEVIMLCRRHVICSYHIRLFMVWYCTYNIHYNNNKNDNDNDNDDNNDDDDNDDDDNYNNNNNNNDNNNNDNDTLYIIELPILDKGEIVPYRMFISYLSTSTNSPTSTNSEWRNNILNGILEGGTHRIKILLGNSKLAKCKCTTNHDCFPFDTDTFFDTSFTNERN